MNKKVVLSKQIARRHRKEKHFRYLCVTSIAIAMMFLFWLLFTIILKGYSSFWSYTITIPVSLDTTIMQVKNGAEGKVDTREVNKLLKRSIYSTLSESNLSRAERRLAMQLFSGASSQQLQKYIENNPTKLGEVISIALPVSSATDMYLKGNVDLSIAERKRKFKDIQAHWIESWQASGDIKRVFNTGFFINGDSREPEQAGLLGSIIGSLWTIAICMALAIPLGVLTAVYLEEFLPKNIVTTFIELNINNLAAVPSIIFGLLGLAIFLNIFGMPRSSALVGGVTLSLMTLPTIVITTRQSLKAVPQSIRDAAFAIGASKMQTTIHHSLPLALPGIMTGIILSVARVMGETAPLLMIGMVAFIRDIPESPLMPATVLPVQIFLWSDSPELGFTERTSAAILVMLLILIAVNALAVYLRKKLEYRW